LSSNRSRTPDFDQPALRFSCVLRGFELEEDEDVARIVDIAVNALNFRLLACLRAILVEHRPPPVVVAHVDPGDDER
jgi:hypothetical protein